MKLETEITAELHAEMLAALLSYRREPIAIDVSTPQLFALALRNERIRTAQCLDKLFEIMKRGRKPALDCEVIDRVESVRRLFLENEQSEPGVLNPS